MIHEQDMADARLLIAYPYYSNQVLVGELCAVPALDVGKWIRKGADEFQWGVLFGSLLAKASEVHSYVVGNTSPKLMPFVAGTNSASVKRPNLDPST
jgi:hypothetical protein